MNRFNWQRAVIKVGSALIAPEGNECSGRYLLSLARFITASRENLMMANWQRFFDFPCAQVLLTADDLRDRTRYVNIKNTLREILNHNALPIVNENDTVAVNELKVGDNDNLGAYTALVAQADTLIIDPRKDASATLIPQVDKIDSTIYGLAGGAGTAVGTGGMRTKIEAADKCTSSGIQTLIVNGRKGETFDTLLEGKVPGTLFNASSTPASARRLWLTHTLKTAGRIEVDSGAKEALVRKGASLLPSGIVDVAGLFEQGDAVEVVCQGEVIAKGLCLYNAKDLTLIKGKKSKEIASVLGYETTDVAIHRDDMVLYS